MIPNIIAFAGRKQSGKSSSANFVANTFGQKEPCYAEMGGRSYLIPGREAWIYNFADPLKQMCMEMFGLTYEQVYGTDDQKNELVNCYWENKQLTAREVLQLVGTDMFRKLKHNVWADATIRKIQHDESKTHFKNLAIIADCRFPNEVETIKKANGIVIKLTRNPYNSTHSSETALDPDNYDQSNFDFIIDNHNLTEEEKNIILNQYLEKIL